MDNSQWGVWCRVSGGVTGLREAWMKGADGKPLAFATEEEARAKAIEAKRGIGPFSGASFCYTALPLSGA